MRIGLIIYGELTRAPGSYLYDRYLVRGLSKLGHELDVISLPERDYGRHVLDNLSWRLRRQLLRGRFDILLQDETNHPSLFFLNRSVRRSARFPIVSIVHGLRSQQPWSRSEARIYTRIEREYLQGVDGVIVKREGTRDEITELVGRALPSVLAQPGRDHIRPDIDTDSADTRARQSGPLRLLFLGDVIRSKGLHFLLAGLASLPKSEVRLDVVGDLQQDSSYVRDTQATIVREGLTQMVTLWGSLRGESLLERLRIAQALAITSVGEGFGMAYLEAMGFFLPVLAARGGSAPTLVTDGEHGFLVNRRRPDEIAAAVRKWSTDRELLAMMGRAAHARFLEQPTWSQTAETVAEFLDERLQSHRRIASTPR